MRRGCDQSQKIPTSQERPMFATRHGVALREMSRFFFQHVMDLNLRHANQTPSCCCPFSNQSLIRAFFIYDIRSTCLVQFIIPDFIILLIDAHGTPTHAEVLQQKLRFTVLWHLRSWRDRMGCWGLDLSGSE
jgi:hypothetical protein